MRSQKAPQMDSEITPASSEATAPLDRWIPTQSRLGWPGRFAKRLIRRSLRFAFGPQSEFNDRLVTKTSSLEGALQVETLERRDAILDLEGRMLARVEALETTLTQLAGDMSRELQTGLCSEEKIHQDIEEQILRERESRLSEAGLLLRRIEAIESHSIAFQSDVIRDFSEVRVTAATQGRHLDDVAGQLVALAHTVGQLEEEWRSRPDLREALLADLEQRLLSVRSEIAQTAEVAHEDLLGLERRQHASLEETRKELGDLRDDWLESTASIREALQTVRDSIRDEEETRERDLHAIETTWLERETDLRAETRRVQSDLVAGTRGVESALDDLRESGRHEWKRLESAIEGLGGRIVEGATEREALSAMLETIDTTVGSVASTLETVERRAIDVTTAAEGRSRDTVTAMERRLYRLERRVLPPDRIGHYDFNQMFRGESSEILIRFEPYMGFFSGLGRVLDVGCGRGEFLTLCRDRGIGAMGVDSDPDMIGHCRLQGLEVVQADLLEHLRSLPDAAIDGLFCAQVVEHLSPGEILEVLEVAASRLRRGAPVVIETINPGTWTAMRWFFLDPTHCQPVPPDMIQYLLKRAGFTVRDIAYGPPLPDGKKLLLPNGKEFEQKDAKTKSLVELLKKNGSLLNETLFGPQDYAIVAER